MIDFIISTLIITYRLEYLNPQNELVVETFLQPGECADRRDQILNQGLKVVLNCQVEAETIGPVF